MSSSFLTDNQYAISPDESEPFSGEIYASALEELSLNLSKLQTLLLRQREEFVRLSIVVLPAANSESRPN
jgi:hypothetical protein